MRTESREQTSYSKVYITKDGREFTNESDAKNHEEKLNGNRKDCTKCGGKGKVNGRYETRYENASWIPTHCEEKQVWVEDTCTECQGKGYKELKWI